MDLKLIFVQVNFKKGVQARLTPNDRHESASGLLPNI